MKKSILISLSLLSVVSFSATLISTIMPTQLTLISATKTITQITLDENNQPLLSSGNGTLKYNDFVTIKYTNASKNENGHVILADGGTIYKEEASNDLKSFTANFSGKLLLYTGYFGYDDTCYEYTLTNGIIAEIKGNYFKLISYGSTSISDIVIDYGCQNEVVEDLDLSSYTISYLENDKEAEYAANELFSVLSNRVSGLAESKAINSKRACIYLTSSDEFNSQYKIEHPDRAFMLTSDTAVGLIEAARDFINTTNSETKLENWYKTPLTNEYNLLEKATMMSYNVRVADDGTLANGDSGNVADRLPRVAKNILAFMPDTVGVQEASDRWISGLKEKLMPQYGYIGYGRESNYAGESSGIFYNKDKVNLIEGHTYWFSDTPEVAGSHFDDYGGYNRIMTYGVFERLSDGYRYIHANTHFDLVETANQKDAIKCDEILSPYKDQLPIFVTGDFNCKASDEDWAYDEFVNNRNYIDSKYEAVDSNFAQYTYPQDGYIESEAQKIIDFCLKANSGLHFTKYLVDTNKYSGDDVEDPQLTSDHYPIYLEAIPYEPLVPFSNDSEINDVSIDNGFALHNHNFGLVRNESKYANAKTVLAYKSDTNGELIDKKLNFTNHFAINPNVTNGYVEYKFTSEDNGLADLNVVMANSLSSPSGTQDLSQYITVTLNGEDINVENLNLRCSDIRSDMYEWENLVIRDTAIKNGENTLRIATKTNQAPYQLLLEIFSDIEVTPNESDDDETSYYYFKLGTEQITIKRLNKTFENQRTSVEIVDGEQYLTIELLNNEETVLKMADGSDLDASLDFTNYKKVTITGAGALTIQYTNEYDGIACNDLTIESGTTLNITGANTTKKTGIKAYGILQIDGVVNVTKYGNAVGFNTDKDGSSTATFALNVGATGQLIIDEAANGINVWNTPSGGASINVDGTLTLTNISGEGIKLDQIVPINFNDGSNISISAQKAGIYYHNNSDSDIITLTGDANVTMNISTGSGILFANQGKLYLRDSSSLEITANSSGIYGFNVLFVCEGGNDDHSKNTASLKIHSAGSGNGSTSIGSDGRTQDGNPIQGRAGHTYFLFDTTGEVLIEKTGTKGKTGIHLGGSAGSKAYFQVYASNMTIKNCSNATGCWVNRTWTVNYDYESSGCAKVNIINCTNIYSGNTSTISTTFTNDTCNVSAN